MQEAAEKISSLSASISSLLTPYTILGISLPGAVNKTFSTPLPCLCLPKASLSVNTPVLSITNTSLNPCAV